MKWDYLVEDVYDDSSLVPNGVPPNRLMRSNELLKWVENWPAGVKGMVLAKDELSD
jgi:hypothetical protein